jgi:hypothetical protein
MHRRETGGNGKAETRNLRRSQSTLSEYEGNESFCPGHVSGVRRTEKAEALLLIGHRCR